MTDIGRFDFDLMASHTMLYELQPVAGEPYDDFTGLYVPAFDGQWPDWRFNAGVSWTFENMFASVVYRYSDRVDIQNDDPTADADPVYEKSHLSSFGTLDLQFTYTFGWDMDVSVGVENVKGRMYYLRVTQRF